MKFKSYVMFAVMAEVMFLAAPVMAQSQTAQSAMVNLTTDNTAYQIEGTITWTYDRDSAERHWQKLLQLFREKLA